jgi:hypothetical protein
MSIEDHGLTGEDGESRSLYARGVAVSVQLGEGVVGRKDVVCTLLEGVAWREERHRARWHFSDEWFVVAVCEALGVAR